MNVQRTASIGVLLLAACGGQSSPKYADFGSVCRREVKASVFYNASAPADRTYRCSVPCQEIDVHQLEAKLKSEIPNTDLAFAGAYVPTDNKNSCNVAAWIIEDFYSNR